MNYAVIMAGGSGKRLWPLSRRKRPKQVLKLVEGQTLLGLCFDRLRPIFDPEHILVLTNVAFVDIVRETLPELSADNVIAEPAICDTSAAIGLAATVLAARDAQATMAVVTADQVMRPAEVFQQAVSDALAFVDGHQDHLVTFGVKPTFASTQYGYTKCTDPASVSGLQNQVYTVEAFREKPDPQTAQQYLDSGQYFWNSGLFVWRARTILNCLERFLPDATGPLQQIQKAWDTPQRESVLTEWFVKIPKISIDFAVMEKATRVSAIRLDCSWLDLGSFNAIADVIEADANRNVVGAKTHELLDCNNNIIVTEQDGHLIAAIGLNDMVVAHSPDATLICPVDQTERLKELLQAIETNRKEQYL